MTTPTARQIVDRGVEIGLLQGLAQPGLPTPESRFANPELRIPSLDSGQVPQPPAKPSVLVMHYDLGTLD